MHPRAAMGPADRLAGDPRGPRDEGHLLALSVGPRAYQQTKRRLALKNGPGTRWVHTWLLYIPFCWWIYTPNPKYRRYCLKVPLEVPPVPSTSLPSSTPLQTSSDPEWQPSTCALDSQALAGAPTRTTTEEYGVTGRGGIVGVYFTWRQDKTYIGNPSPRSSPFSKK